MGKQKGRKHRRVNRTPRPVAGGQRHERPASGPSQADDAPDLDYVLRNLGYKRLPTQPTQPTVRSVLQKLASFEPAGPVFYNKARDGGLGHHAQRTWDRLKELRPRGATVEDLCETVGYTERTINKHLEGLSRYGLAEQQGDRWVATGKSQWAAAKEYSLPDRRAQERERVLGRMPG